jgi:hypothetical protein
VSLVLYALQSLQFHRLVPVRLQPQLQVDVVIAIEELQQRINDKVLTYCCYYYVMKDLEEVQKYICEIDHLQSTSMSGFSWFIGLLFHDPPPYSGKVPLLLVTGFHRDCSWMPWECPPKKTAPRSCLWTSNRAINSCWCSASELFHRRSFLFAIARGSVELNYMPYFVEKQK